MGILARLLKRISPYVFTDINKIDPTEEGLLDYCPICDERLPDRKVRTFKLHELQKHKRTEKEIVRQAITNSLPMIFIVAAFGGVGLFTVLGPPIFDYMDSIDGYTLTNRCQDTINEFEAQLYETKEVSEPHLEMLQFLIGECDMRMSIYPTEEGEWKLVDIKSLFEDESRYEINVKLLEETGYREASSP